MSTSEEVCVLKKFDIHYLVRVPENRIRVVVFGGIKPEIYSVLSVSAASSEHICLQNVRLTCSVAQELEVYLIMLIGLRC